MHKKTWDRMPFTTFAFISMFFLSFSIFFTAQDVIKAISTDNLEDIPYFGKEEFFYMDVALLAMLLWCLLVVLLRFDRLRSLLIFSLVFYSVCSVTVFVVRCNTYKGEGEQAELFPVSIFLYVVYGLSLLKRIKK